MPQTARTTEIDPTALPWEPNAPGETIQEDILDRHRITQGELASRLGVGRRAVNEIVGGKRAISTEMALRLSALTGQTAQYWLTLQTNFDLYCAGKSFDLSQVTPIDQDLK